MKNKPEPETEKKRVKLIERLIERVNKSKRRQARHLPRLTYQNDGWRLVFERYLEDYTFLPSGAKLLEMAVYDFDGQGPYYWIPIAPAPKGIVTPALRLMDLMR